MSEHSKPGDNEDPIVPDGPPPVSVEDFMRDVDIYNSVPHGENNQPVPMSPMNSGQESPENGGFGNVPPSR